MLHSVVYTILLIMIMVILFNLYSKATILTSSISKNEPVAEEEEVILEEEVEPEEESRVKSKTVAEKKEATIEEEIEPEKESRVKCVKSISRPAKVLYDKQPSTLGLSLDIDQLNNSVIQRELSNILGNINKTQLVLCSKYKKEFSEVLTNLEDQIESNIECKQFENDIVILTNDILDQIERYYIQYGSDINQAKDTKDNIVKSTNNIINEIKAVFYNTSTSNFDKKQF